MPTLTVDQLHCVQDTPEWTPDEVYLVVAVTGRAGRCRLRAFSLSAPEWQGLAPGERRAARLEVDPDWAPDSLVLAALLERDGEQDFAPGGRLDQLLESLEDVRRLFISLQDQPRVFLAAHLLTEMDQAIARAAGDDRPLGPAQLIEPVPGEPLEIGFAGQGGRYRLRFSLR
ncbi:hypothetical protein D0B54_04715 [Solimonas sp. K1W22B-7]|uniref:hypothetical protein n=1 Tax=Solimonas sp. K1W22B-7 TaxID=2303331 RepID=UPI000E32DC35|nr:hypothetical protein [Solimonas sp. K1W22B-7]AXQ28015.1 hypothetical protein D0B54_04715 [Solimonas sp. K1W22B-7]